MPFADKQLQREYQREWYQRNREKRLQQQKEWRASNKDKKKEQDRRYRERHKDKENKRKRDWARANKHRETVRRNKSYVYHNSAPGVWQRKMEVAKAQKYRSRWGELGAARFLSNEIRRQNNGKKEQQSTDSREYAKRIVGYIERSYRRKDRHRHS